MALLGEEKPKYVRWNQSMLVGTRIVTFESACTYTTRKLFCLIVTWKGGHFILFEMAVTWEPLVRFWFFQGQSCLKLNFWPKFWQFDHETTRITWWFRPNWRVLELCRALWYPRWNILGFVSQKLFDRCISAIGHELSRDSKLDLW